MIAPRAVLVCSVLLGLTACAELARSQYDAGLYEGRRHNSERDYTAARTQLEAALEAANRLDEPERTGKLSEAFHELSASDETEARRRYGMELTVTPTSPPPTPTQPPVTATPLPKEVIRAARTPPAAPHDQDFLGKREMIENLCTAQVEFQETLFEAEQIAREQGGNWVGEPDAMHDRAERRLSLSAQQYRRRYGSLPASLLTRDGNYICPQVCAGVIQDYWFAAPCNENACQHRLAPEHPCNVLQGLRCGPADAWPPACAAAKALRQHAMCGDVIAFIASERCWQLLQSATRGQ